MGFLLGGGGAMALLMLARQRLSWWPLHPVGFPVAATNLMNAVVTSVFLAWAAKVLVLRFGGASGYRRSRSLFLGMIAGQMLSMGLWLVVDYFAGGVGNRVF